MDIEEVCNGHDYGIIRPGFAGRWSWPFVAMEPGDYFHVDQAQKSAKDMRRVASVRMNQEDKYVSVVKDSPLLPGHTLVICTPPPDQRGFEMKQSVVLEYASAQAKIDQWYYGIDLGRIAGGTLEGFGKVFVKASKVAQPLQDRLVFTMANWTIGAMFKEDGVEFKRLPDRATPAQWEKLDTQWDAQRDQWANAEREERLREDALRHGIAYKPSLSDAMG